MASLHETVLDRPVNDTGAMLAPLGMASATHGTGRVPLTVPLDVALPIRKAATTGIASFGPDPDDGLDGLDRDSAALPTARRLLPSRRETERKGSRQRRRWENDRLLHVPNAQPPLPSDWEIRPTHPVHNHVPYHIAHVWDAGLRRHVNETRAAAAVLRRQQFVAQQSGAGRLRHLDHDPNSQDTPQVGLVTRELRAAAKKVPAVKMWVRVLEEPIRAFVLRAAEAGEGAAGEGAAGNDGAEADDAAHDSDGTDDTDNTEDTTDYDYYRGRKATPTATPSVSCFSGDEDDGDDGDDDIVFVGRRPATVTAAAAAAAPVSPARHREGAGLVLGMLPGDGGNAGPLAETGSFQRWLIHSVAEYYGLVSQSATLGRPPRRAVYVTLRAEATRPGCGPQVVPRPMGELF